MASQTQLADRSNLPTTSDTTPVTILSHGRLNGKVALVTGGAVGFGAAITKKFTAEGAKVVVVDINADLARDVAKSYPDGNVIPVAGDVSKIETWHNALKAALDSFGKLDVVVNNAGVVQKATPSHEVDEEEFDRLIRINVKPLFLSCKVIVPYLRKRGQGGSFINLSSTSAPRPRPKIVWYGTSKGAVSTTTKGLAVEYAPDNIRFNAILPALGETAMLPLVLGKEDTPENRAPLLASIPLGRFTAVTDVANVACFLASDEASYMTDLLPIFDRDSNWDRKAPAVFNITLTGVAPFLNSQNWIQEDVPVAHRPPSLSISLCVSIMVATRNHPKEFPEPSTPSSSTPTKSSPTKTTSPTKPSPPTPNFNATTTAVAKTPTRTRSTTLPGYVHIPDRILVVWLLLSLPLILWDTLYVLFRPHTMPGGKFHSPIWTPYALYGTIDYMYGWPAWNARIGFTAAQGSLNAIEFAMDVFYLWVVFANGKVRRGEKKDVRWFVWEEKKVEGAGLAVLVVFAAAVMTLSKTVLYWLNEAFSGFDNIGHNSMATLIPMWIIPNGAWIVLPSYMIYVLGVEIWASLDAAGAKKSR